MSDLEPLSPSEAVRLYLEHRKPDLAKSSLENQRYRLGSFEAWCGDEDIDNLNELTGRDLHRFRIARSEGTIPGYDALAPVSLNGVLSTIRVFLEFCASVDGVEPGLRERVLLPDFDDEEAARDEMLDDDRAEELLDYLERFRYASREHVIVALLWHAGIRLGSLRAIDVGDIDLEEGCIDLRHRPETDTPLKNASAAERSVHIGEHFRTVLQDYLQHTRHDVTDEHGRRPLITSSQGRLSPSPIRRTVYQWTRPCEYTGECPHDEDLESCEYLTREGARDCPSSRSPHGIRRGSITRHLREGVPREVVVDRMNVSREVLDLHYDERTEREKMQIRREFLES